MAGDRLYLRPIGLLYGDAGANAATLAEMKRLLLGQPVPPAPEGLPAPPAAPPTGNGSC